MIRRGVAPLWHGARRDQVRMILTPSEGPWRGRVF